MQEWVVEEFVAKQGAAPFSDWVFSLKDTKGRSVILSRLKRLKLGNFGDCRFVGEKVFELRIDFGPGYRVYFSRIGERVLLLAGGDKNSQSKDIEKSREYLAEYRSREHETK